MNGVTDSQDTSLRSCKKLSCDDGSVSRGKGHVRAGGYDLDVLLRLPLTFSEQSLGQNRHVTWGHPDLCENRQFFRQGFRIVAHELDKGER